MEQKQYGDVLVKRLPYILEGDVLANSGDVLVVEKAGAFWRRDVLTGYSFITMVETQASTCRYH